MILNININKKVAQLADKAVIICGNSDYIINFTFDDEWAAFSTKTARFIYNGQYIDVVFMGTQCAVPVIKNATGVYVGVFAGDLHTTTPAYINCDKSILCADGAPAEPTPDVYAQIMQLINSGAIKGEKGDKGDKGEDYILTEADKKEIAGDVENGLDLDNDYVPRMHRIDENEGNNNFINFAERYNRLYGERSRGRGVYGRWCLVEEPIPPVDPDGAYYEHNKGEYFTKYPDKAIDVAEGDTIEALVERGKISAYSPLTMAIGADETINDSCIVVNKPNEGEQRLVFNHTGETLIKTIFETEIYFDLDNIVWHSSSKWLMRIRFLNEGGNVWTDLTNCFYHNEASNTLYVSNGVRYVEIPNKKWCLLRIEQVGKNFVVLLDGLQLGSSGSGNVLAEVTNFTGVRVDFRSGSYAENILVKFANIYVGSVNDSTLAEGATLASVVQRTNKGYVRVPAFNLGEEPSKSDITYLDQIAVPFKYVKAMQDEILTGLNQIITAQNELLGG